MSSNHVTRGQGLLESFLAKKRSRQANQLIPDSYRAGKLADIGCGSYPFFLLHTRFKEKYGVDQVIDAGYIERFSGPNCHFRHYDMQQPHPLPFEKNSLDVVTALAVFEHIPDAPLKRLLREIYKALNSGGLFIMTTPAFWTEGLLKGMARLQLVSAEEIGEHEGHYKISKTVSLLRESGFKREKMESGYFELFMNTWVRARK